MTEANPNSSDPQSTYLHGHHPSVLRSHTRRTAANSCAYLLPHLDKLPPDATILDIGCGPGTITVDIARLYPHTHVVGIDTAAAERDGVLDMARRTAEERGVQNVTFAVGDILDIGAVQLPNASASAEPQQAPHGWDVIHIHQVLQHIPSAVLLHALRSVRAACTPGKTLVAAREVDFLASIFYPPLPLLDKFLNVYGRCARSKGADPTAGSRVHAWLRAAGFDSSKMQKGCGTWCFSSQEERDWWGGLWAERVVTGELSRTAVEGGIATEEEMQQISGAFMDWAADEDGWTAIIHGEVLCWV